MIQAVLTAPIQPGVCTLSRRLASSFYARSRTHSFPVAWALWGRTAEGAGWGRHCRAQGNQI